MTVASKESWQLQTETCGTLYEDSKDGGIDQ